MTIVVIALAISNSILVALVLYYKDKARGYWQSRNEWRDENVRVSRLASERHKVIQAVQIALEDKGLNLQ